MHRWILRGLHSRLNQTHFFSCERALTLGPHTLDPLYSDIPRAHRDKSKRKPFPTPMKILIQKAKREKEARKAHPCRMLEHPPENGLLVPELVEVAHQVYRSRQSLLSSLSKLVKVIPVQCCRYGLSIAF